MYKAFALVRNIRSPGDELRFNRFSLSRVNPAQIKRTQAIFGNLARLNHWLYEREYAQHSADNEMSALRQISFDLEDTVLLLRLFRVGDISFFHHRVVDANGELLQAYPTRAMAELYSTAYYDFHQTDCKQWEDFANRVMGSPGWTSLWFQVARRFFLYGGAKEFNPSFDESDRVVDFMIALEACLVPEHDFVGRRLRERAMRLLKQDKNLRALLRDFYDIRSTIVHGSSLGQKQRNKLHNSMQDFERAVRQILVFAVRTIPSETEPKKLFLQNAFNVSRWDSLVQAVKYIKAFVSV
jgi:hypothetical protein